jgi:hypothetical protein
MFNVIASCAAYAGYISHDLVNRVSARTDRLSVTAPYLPLCLVAFSWLLQGGFDAAVGDIVCA